MVSRGRDTQGGRGFVTTPEKTLSPSAPLQSIQLQHPAKVTSPTVLVGG